MYPNLYRDKSTCLKLTDYEYVILRDQKQPRMDYVCAVLYVIYIQKILTTNVYINAKTYIFAWYHNNCVNVHSIYWAEYLICNLIITHSLVFLDDCLTLLICASEYRCINVELDTRLGTHRIEPTMHVPCTSSKVEIWD